MSEVTLSNAIHGEAVTATQKTRPDLSKSRSMGPKLCADAKICARGDDVGIRALRAPTDARL